MQKWFARIAKREDVMLFITEMLQEPGGEGGYFFFGRLWISNINGYGEMEYDREFMRIQDFSYFNIFFPAARNTFFLQPFPGKNAASQSRPVIFRVIPGDPTDSTWLLLG